MCIGKLLAVLLYLFIRVLCPASLSLATSSPKSFFVSLLIPLCIYHILNILNTGRMTRSLCLPLLVALLGMFVLAEVPKPNEHGIIELNPSVWKEVVMDENYDVLVEFYDPSTQSSNFFC